MVSELKTSGLGLPTFNSQDRNPLAAIALLALLSTLPVLAQPAPNTAKEWKPSELGSMDIEELMKIRVTSVSRKEEALANTAAAVYVLTPEQIHRAGFNTIPETLRIAPGLEVARLDAHDWAISSRGFNDVFANKLLVLFDGRSVYTPLFSGVFWDVQDTLLEDLDRIEVIEGPGATIWGANAVNGVINIITKSARETQGALLTAGGGTADQVVAGARYGGQLTSNVYYRVYGKYVQSDAFPFENGSRGYDSSQMSRGGFRLDWEAPNENHVTFQGEIYDGQEHQIFIVPTFLPPFSLPVQDRIDLSGGNVLGRWTRSFSEDSNLQLQMYYDRTYRNSGIFREDRHTGDIDAQYRFAAGRRNDIVAGFGYRISSDDLGNTTTISHSPSSRAINLFSSFIQDEITLVEEKLHLVLGSKFEHNDFTGFELQPSGRILWRPSPPHTIWSAISRAVRTPSRAEDDIRLNQQIAPAGVFGPLPTEFVLFGDRSFQSEKLVAYELGYRAELHKSLFLDLAAYYNDYDDLRSIEPGTPFQEASPGPLHTVNPFTVRNLLEGSTYGGTAALTWQVNNWWRLRPSYTFLEMELHRKPGSLDNTSILAEGNSPRHQVYLFSTVDLTSQIAFDSNLRYVDRLPNLQTPGYVELDLRLGWKPLHNLELSLVWQNLLHDRHPEFNRSFVNNPRTEIERSFFGKLTWRF